MDAALFSLINQSHSPALDDVMLLASALGKAAFVWVAVALIAMVYPARRMAAFRVLVAVLCAYAVVDGVLKRVVDRDRPFVQHAEVRLIDQRPDTSSFPSGHAASAFAGALATSRLFPVARIVWWPLAILIAVSRVYVGAHWPTDVVAGAVIGFAVAWFTLGGSGRFGRLGDRRAGGAER